MSITRRVFLRNGGLAVIGTAAIPLFLTRAAYATQSLSAQNKRLVVIFQRGAADGLNIVVPHGERAYYAMRPSINIPRNAVLDLDGFFGLHPSLSPFQPLWKQRHLAIVHAAGSPEDDCIGLWLADDPSTTATCKGALAETLDAGTL